MKVAITRFFTAAIILALMVWYLTNFFHQQPILFVAIGALALVVILPADLTSEYNGFDNFLIGIVLSFFFFGVIVVVYKLYQMWDVGPGSVIVQILKATSSYLV